jgi:hypothetical protein
MTKQSTFINTRFQVQNVTMKLRGGSLSSGLRWSKEQDEISRNTNRQARRLSIMYYTVAVTSVLCLIAPGLPTSYLQLSGAADGNRTVVNVNLRLCFAIRPEDVMFEVPT